MERSRRMTYVSILVFVFTLFLPKSLAFAEEIDKVWDPEKGTISGYIWFDENEDGWMDPQEHIVAPELGEIKLYLINENEEIIEEKIVSRLQNGQAHYYFEVEEGNYKIRAEFTEKRKYQVTRAGGDSFFNSTTNETRYYQIMKSYNIDSIQLGYKKAS
ncbi:SdrD B-like domain-containing protein [Bacillus cereus]|uniref:SdrD B-like domain-containing protein n=1 Tax=Bacillus cereus group TaxID=86661 RepID=UPI000B4B15F7|nr:SdrD B-like domain-containing protein [Bacillus cereus]